MGWGDEIIASGEAKRLFDKTGEPVIIRGRRNEVRWSPVWKDSPYIIGPGQNHKGSTQDMKNCGGHRFYLDYERMSREFNAVYPGRSYTSKVQDGRLPYRFNNWKSARGELHFVKRSEQPKYIIIEPHFKPRQWNRDWGWTNWVKVVRLLPKLPWVQIDPIGKPILPGVKHIPANNFIKACELMGDAIMYVGPEGGLYHAAGALHIKSVAIFGGWVSPENQGYEESVNIYDPEGSPCGSRIKCKHCMNILRSIRPKDIANHVERLYDEHLSSL